MELLSRLRLSPFLFVLALLVALQGAQWKEKRYVFREHGFAISFPSKWKVTVHPPTGEEVRFTLSYTTDVPGVHGLVQVWKIADLKGFIDQSLTTAPSLEDVGVRPYALQGLQGYYVTYLQRIPGGKIYVHDVLVTKPDKTVYRLVYMVPAKQAGKECTELFHQLLSSFRLLDP